jgi:hypothetical protein
MELAFISELDSYAGSSLVAGGVTVPGRFWAGCRKKKIMWPSRLGSCVGLTSSLCKNTGSGRSQDPKKAEEPQKNKNKSVQWRNICYGFCSEMLA